MTITNYKNVTISAYTVTGTFSAQIFLPFVPTSCKIKFVSYTWINTADNVDSIGLIKSSLINNEIVYSLARKNTTGDSWRFQSKANLKYKLSGQPINGIYNFSVCNIYGNNLDNFGVLEIAMTIEFIEEI